MLDFKGRTYIPSSKNFQLIEERQNPDFLFMQFGEVKKGSYELILSAPFSVLQAAAIAFATFEG